MVSPNVFDGTKNFFLSQKRSIQTVADKASSSRRNCLFYWRIAWEARGRFQFGGWLRRSVGVVQSGERPIESQVFVQAARWLAVTIGNKCAACPGKIRWS